MKLINLFTRLKNDVKGLAAMEFAMISPVFLSLMLGAVEASNYIYVKQKAENAVNNILNILNKQEKLSSDDIKSLTEIIPQISYPVTLGYSDYRIFITAIQRDKPDPIFNKPYIFWQENYGGYTNFNSDFSYKGPDRTQNALPEGSLRGYQFEVGDQVILIEMGIKYTPLVTGSFAPDYGLESKFFSFSRPRKGAYAIRPSEVY